MSIHTGKRPVFVSHTKEIEQMASFLADLQHRLQVKRLIQGNNPPAGPLPEAEAARKSQAEQPIPERSAPIAEEKVQCLLRVRAKCSDLLLRMYAEDSEIMLVSPADDWWIRNIVHFVQDVILKNRQKAG